MANAEHLNILKEGVREWNEWRDDNPEIKPNLDNADLSINNLRDADFSDASLAEANLGYADLTRSNLNGATLNHANLMGSNAADARLDYADLFKANLQDANFSRARLDYANLTSTNLRAANLSNAKLYAATLTDATLGGTVLAFVNLSDSLGLEHVNHVAPSEVSNRTIDLSRGKIPEVFLRGCGLRDWEIEGAKLNQPDLSNEEITDILYRIHDLRAHQAIQINPLFISYSHADDRFVDEIERNLNELGIRFWRDIHHATAGRLERQVDRAIRLNPTVLLILSAASVTSDWVEHEVRLARELEKETGRDILCPVALDTRWKTCDWPARLREQVMEYNILNFSDWHNYDVFKRMFARLIEGLNLFYKTPEDAVSPSEPSLEPKKIKKKVIVPKGRRKRLPAPEGK